MLPPSTKLPFVVNENVAWEIDPKHPTEVRVNAVPDAAHYIRLAEICIHERKKPADVSRILDADWLLIKNIGRIILREGS